MRSDTQPDVQIFDDVLERIADERPLKETFDLIAQRVAEHVDFDFCGVLLPDDDGRRIHLAGAYNFPARYEELLNGIFRVPYEDATLLASPTSRALREGRTIVLEDALGDPSYEPWRALAEGFGFGSLVSVPLLSRGRAVGVLNGYSKQAGKVAPAELATMERLALQAALALRLTLLVETQHETIDDLRDSNEQLERQRSVLERAHEIHLRLTEAVLSGAGFEEVAGVLSDLVDRPVVVLDVQGRPICGSVDEDDAAPITANIRIGDEAVGSVMVADTDAASRDLDVRAVEHGATVLAVHVAKERVARATEERLHSDFLHDLLEGRDDPARLRERAVHYGLALGEPHRVVLIVADEVAASPPGNEEDRRLRRDRALRVSGELIRERMSGAVFGRLGNELTVVVPDAELARCRTVAEESRRRGARQVPEFELSVGIGGVAGEPENYPESHEQARRCVDALRRLDRRGATMAIDELGVLGLFLDTNHPEQLVAIGEAVLGPILEYDLRSEGALMRTLESYLDNSCNLRPCAEELFVHQNTVKYRLRKIEELCGLDLRRPDDLLRATIARLSMKLLD